MKDIKNFTFEELVVELANLSQPKFRASQIQEWLFSKQINDFNLMTNLPSELRESLNELYFINSLSVKEEFHSNDGTAKYIFQSNDGVCFETVGIPSMSSGLTVCVSTQAGCKMGCKFCATGRQHFFRNLTIGEIVDQVLMVQNLFNQRVNNVVVMGQGEPFANYNNLIEALSVINNKKLIGIGARHITVSTCGVIPGINKISHINKQYGLAISLHSCIQSTRDSIMPGVRKFPLNELKKALLNYNQATNRRISLEYVLIKGINDNKKDLEELILFSKGLHCHVNILSYNPVEGCDYVSSPQDTINTWINAISREGTVATHRTPRGKDIDGACGQLINKANF